MIKDHNEMSAVGELQLDQDAGLTFPVSYSEVGVGGTDGKDKLVSHQRFIRVDGTYCLNQLDREEKQT